MTAVVAGGVAVVVAVAANKGIVNSICIHASENKFRLLIHLKAGYTNAALVLSLHGMVGVSSVIGVTLVSVDEVVVDPGVAVVGDGLPVSVTSGVVVAVVAAVVSKWQAISF